MCCYFFNLYTSLKSSEACGSILLDFSLITNWIIIGAERRENSMKKHSQNKYYTYDM